MHRKGVCLRSHVSPRDSEHLKAKKKPKKTPPLQMRMIIAIIVPFIMMSV